MKSDTILVLGACGTFGAALTSALRSAYGDNRVVAADTALYSAKDAPYQPWDPLNKKTLAMLIDRYDIHQVYLASEHHNYGGQPLQELVNLLEVAREKKIAKIFWPSSVAVFGSSAPRVRCPQHAPLEPDTLWGAWKVSGEKWMQYYWDKFGLDVRSVRMPGIIYHGKGRAVGEPAGSLHEASRFASEIFNHALHQGVYTCPLKPDAHLPLIYMPDAVRASLEIMDMPAAQLSIHKGYNISAMSLSGAQLASAIRQHLPEFNMYYRPDRHLEIADSWPSSLDDSLARRDWNWDYEYGLSATTKDMLQHLGQTYSLLS